MVYRVYPFGLRSWVSGGVRYTEAADWELLRGRERLSFYSPKYEAVRKGQEVAQANSPSELEIHDLNGHKTRYRYE